MQSSKHWMLTEMTEDRCKMEEEVKALESEIKKNRGNQHWREGNWGSNQQFGKERTKTTFNLKRMNKQGFKKNEERLRNLRDNLNVPTSES